MPLPETAVTRLIRALEKIRLYKTEVKVVPAVQAYFSFLARRGILAESERYCDLDHALTDPTFLKEFTTNPAYNALV